METNNKMIGHRGFVLGRFIVTTCKQMLGAPIIDRCSGRTSDGDFYDGYAIHLSFWRKNQYGERRAGQALVLAKIKKKW